MQRNEQVNSAAAELDLGRRELARAQRLKEKGATALQAFDIAVNRFSCRPRHCFVAAMTGQLSWLKAERHD